MCFADVDLAAEFNLTKLGEKDSVKMLFSENSGIVFQAKDASVEAILKEKGVAFFKIGKATEGKTLKIKNGDQTLKFDIPKLRDTWSRTSFLLDERQSGIDNATERYKNYAKQPLHFKFPEGFSGKLPLDSARGDNQRIKAAIIREKGSNSEREMAYAMDLAGFDVKDVHMTDLISGRETLEDIQFIAAVGGFSNSDVLGSAKGWAGAFLYNEKAKAALDNFFARENTLSLGVCNGCQLFMELGLLHPDHKEKPKMLHNESHKFECNFTSMEIVENDSVMMHSLSGTRLGIWAAHGEGKFSFPYEVERYKIIGKYGYETYPSNPNGSHYNTAMIVSDNGRHLAMMPHLERSTFPWNWAYYPKDRQDEVSPWIEAFVNARKWLEKQEN
jgi:phosphoribosylformylglycinamidine synthase